MRILRAVLAAIVVALSTPGLADPATRLSFDPSRAVMVGDMSSATLYEVPLAGGAVVASLDLAGLVGLYDVFSTGSVLCAEAWVGGAPPATTTCQGEFRGVINPVNGVGHCLQLRGLDRRCDVWNVYNQRPLVMEVGHPDDLGPACPTNPLGQPCVNGYYRVPGDFTGRFFWNNPGYSAVVMIGRKGERARIEAFAVGPMYVHPNYSGTFDSYTVWIGWNGVAWGEDCGYMGHRASHMDGTQIGRHVDLTSTNVAICVTPFFQGANQANMVEYSGNASSFTLSAAYRWAQQMTVRHSY